MCHRLAEGVKRSTSCVTFGVRFEASPLQVTRAVFSDLAPGFEFGAGPGLQILAEGTSVGRLLDLLLRRLGRPEARQRRAWLLAVLKQARGSSCQALLGGNLRVDEPRRGDHSLVG
jgi:hypothetical protein